MQDIFSLAKSLSVSWFSIMKSRPLRGKGALCERGKKEFTVLLSLKEYEGNPMIGCFTAKEIAEKRRVAEDYRTVFLLFRP
jgi:hypothetical protein